MSYSKQNPSYVTIVGDPSPQPGDGLTVDAPNTDAELQDINDSLTNGLASLLLKTQAIEDKLNDKVDVQLTGSKAILATEPFPTGKQGDTLMVFDESTGDTAVYKYISGDWREL